MSWADKAHKKYQVEKLVKEVLRNPEYKKMQQQEDLKCFSCLALISVDYEDTGLDPEQIRELKERDTGVKSVFSDGWDMCGNCGEYLTPSDSFCSACGSRIKWED